MKLKVVIVDFEIPPRVKRWGLRIGIPAALLLGAAAVAYASAPHVFTPTELLTADNLNALQTQITALQTPPGTVVAFAGPVVPSGWLPCDGTAVSRTTYASLFSAIGTVSGSGDGATTFSLPDYRGRFLRGVDATAGRDPDAKARIASANGGNTGDSVGSIQRGATALPGSSFQTSSNGAHNHGGVTGNDIDPGGISSMWYDGPGQYAFNDGSARVASTNGLNHQHSISTDGAHTHVVAIGGDSETRPINAYVNYIIKY